MDFNAQQMRADALIPEGCYRFRVMDAIEKRSTNGNDMINLKLGLAVNGRNVIYWDSLILTAKMFWKIEHFCEATGLNDLLEKGRIMACDCIDKEGTIEIIQKANRDTGVLENQTKDYPAPRESLVTEYISDLNDDIPNF